MNSPEQQAMFKEMGVKTFYIGECIGDSKRATVMSVSYTHLRAHET